MSRQTSWVLGLGSEVQAASCSNWALAEGLVLLQATALFLHPFPQVREHCARERNFQQRRDSFQTRLDVPGLRQSIPQCVVQPPSLLRPTWLPQPRARCSKRVGSFESCRPGDWRVQAAGTGWPRRARHGSAPSAYTAQVCSECPRHTSGCMCSSFLRTSWRGTGNTENHSEGGMAPWLQVSGYVCVLTGGPWLSCDT